MARGILFDLSGTLLDTAVAVRAGAVAAPGRWWQRNGKVRAMRTTIDAAGRIVVPKALRDAMGLTAGRAIDVVYADGRIAIELAPAEVLVDRSDGFPRLVPMGELPPLSDDDIRDTLESTRR